MAESRTPRRVLQWLADTPDTGAPGDTPRVPPPAASTATAQRVETASGRPRKADRRKARRAEFFAARRNQATTARERFEVAVDQLRAVGTDRDLAEATAALEQIAGRRP